MQLSIADLHNDILTDGPSASEVATLLNHDLENTENAKICLAIWGTEFAGMPVGPIHAFQEVHRLLSPKICAYLALEDLHYATDRNLDKIIGLNPIYCSLTWNHENALGGGALSDGRLTSFGKQVVCRLEQSGILIDTAHLNRKTFFDVLSCTKRPVINSHACFDAVCAHPRNLTEEQLRTIVERDGLVGLTFVGDFLHPEGRATADDVIRHIEYFLQRFPISHLAIGSDFFGTHNLPEQIKNYETYSVLVEKLLKMRYNESVIKSLFYDNFIGFLIRRGYR